MSEENYSPYCKECEACGEEGCCSPLQCKFNGKGEYCEGYLTDLKFGYELCDELYEILVNDKKYKDKAEELFDKLWYKWYKQDSDEPTEESK